jgi:hypothetical protein
MPHPCSTQADGLPGPCRAPSLISQQPSPQSPEILGLCWPPTCGGIVGL